MYIDKVIYENVGPISKLEISFPFEDNGNPKPVIFVGGNGSGKSTILSNIVDSFYEMAGIEYNNARYYSEGNNQQYFKAVGQIQISIGKEYMYSYISYKGENECCYLCKSGNISFEELHQKIQGIENLKWENEKNYKVVTIEKQNIQKVWKSNVICYFGPDRYAKPAWMGDRYFYNMNEHPSIGKDIVGVLDKPIMIKDVTSDNLLWLLDIICDSRPDIEFQDNKTSMVNSNIDDLKLLGNARKNLERILSEILREEVFFSLNYRNSKDSRFRIIRRKDNSVVVPTLDSLSTGQLALFNMFSTIVRYADINDINKSINLADIKGIVVIDEIELHLHTTLQKEVLPKLMRLFPKIQFIVTTHAPLFLLGMKDTYGEGKFGIYELPSAASISTERFSEFLNAYYYLQKTETYQRDAEIAIKKLNINNKPIIITEGETDWKHLKAALKNLRNDERFSDFLSNLDFEFFEYVSQDDGKTKNIIKMGNSTMVQMCENISKFPQPVKYIFIADSDDTDVIKKLASTGEKYKCWGNNVYSFIIPTPSHRENTPNISIEHYYTDAEIKTEYTDTQTGVTRRLYIGNEFDNRGIAVQIDRFCEKRSKCGKDSIAIIEGSQNEKVTCLNNYDGTNYALPKTTFANMILEGIAPFDNFNFDSFMEIFKVIKDIISD